MRPQTTLLLVLALSTALWAKTSEASLPQENESSFALLRARSETALDRRDFPDAETAARNLLRLDAHSAVAMNLIARALEGRRMPRESLEWFTRAAKIATPGGEDLRVVALDYVQLSDYADAAHWLSRATEIAPENAEAWYDLARARMMLGDLRGARAPLVRSLTLRPRSVKGLNNLGLVEEAEGHLDRAEQDYRQAIEWQRGDPRPGEQPLLNLGTLLLTRQRGAEALPLLEQAASLAPKDARCREQFARALEQQRRPAEALEQMRAAVELEPATARLHFELGQMYRRAGMLEEGRRELAISGRLYGQKSSEIER